MIGGYGDLYVEVDKAGGRFAGMKLGNFGKVFSAVFY